MEEPKKATRLRTPEELGTEALLQGHVAMHSSRASKLLWVVLENSSKMVTFILIQKFPANNCTTFMSVL